MTPNQKKTLSSPAAMPTSTNFQNHHTPCIMVDVLYASIMQHLPCIIDLDYKTPCHASVIFHHWTCLLHLRRASCIMTDQTCAMYNAPYPTHHVPCSVPHASCISPHPKCIFHLHHTFGTMPHGPYRSQPFPLIHKHSAWSIMPHALFNIPLESFMARY